MAEIIAEGRGIARPTRAGKQELAKAMYIRGKNFLAAAMFLRHKGGYEYVVLHILCQGIEIILKALLLFKDYDAYKKLLPQPRETY